MVYDRTHTRDLGKLEGMGLSQALPYASVTFLVASMASMGLPGFSGFVAELQVRPPFEDLDRHVVATAELGRVGNDRIDLVGRVAAMQESSLRSPTRATANDHDIPHRSGPLALHANEARPEVEDQVVALAVGQGLEHADTDFGGDVGNCELRDRALLVGREHLIPR